MIDTWAGNSLITPISSSQISHPQLHFHISCYCHLSLTVFFSLLFDPVLPVSTSLHPISPSLFFLCDRMSINQSWQWHVEFFITSPQGHHAVRACVSCCYFSTLTFVHTHSVSVALFGTVSYCPVTAWSCSSCQWLIFSLWPVVPPALAPTLWPSSHSGPTSTAWMHFASTYGWGRCVTMGVCAVIWVCTCVVWKSTWLCF